ncbi:hypothetical protein CAEBREN_21672 [Caenorhabditis brenneri]|uniref:BZIP domain-containing protein n=1 Tax=Caenorhabditis brenneri TaxID=135651 RepID=G0N631_CAEBE|nr:hypothetical protein CAEBREN_21672 [Caenorhabditis brenneri]
MDDTTNFHQFDPSDLPPIIPMEDGPPKYDPDPSLSEIVAERGFKSDSEMIRRHQEQNRPFRSVSPMDFTSNPLCNNQEFARSGQIEPGDTYDVKLHLVQFSSHPTYDNSVRKDPDLKDPDGFLLMDQDSGDCRRNSCISSGPLGAIELNYQILQPPILPHQPHGPTGTPPVAHRHGSGAHGQAAQKYDPGAHRRADGSRIQGHNVEGYDPPGHHQAKPNTDQHHGTYLLGHDVEGYDPPGHHQAEPNTDQNHDVNSNHSYAHHSTLGLTIDASKLNRSDNAGALHYNGNENDQDMSSGPYVAQIPIPYQGQPVQGQHGPFVRKDLSPYPHRDAEGQLDPQFGQSPERDAHGATHVREAGSNPVGHDHRGQSAGSRRHLATLDGRNPSEQPIGPDLGSGQTTGPDRKLPTQGGQDRLGQHTGPDLGSGPPVGSRAHPYKKGSRSKRPKPKTNDPSEMTVEQFVHLQLEEAGRVQQQTQLQSQQAHRPQDQFQYSPESELWTQPTPQGEEQNSPHRDQIPYKKEPWDPQFAGQQELLDQLQLELDHDLEQWTQPQLQDTHTHHLQDQLCAQPPQKLLSRQSDQQAPCQDQILYNPGSWTPTGNGYTVPVHHSSHYFPVPQGINYSAAEQTSENYEDPPAHIPITAQPLEEDLYDLDDWKRNTPAPSDQCRAPVNIIPQPSSQRTSISEYTNDTTSSSAHSSPSFRRSSMDEAFLQAQKAILSDGLDEMEDLHDATIGTYADFARSIDLQLPVHVPCVPAARDSTPTSESSFDGYSPPPSRSLLPKARRNRENPRLKRTAEQKRDRKREQNRKDSKKSVARKQSRREEAEKHSEYIKNSVKKQKGANLEFERNMEDLLAGYDSYLVSEKQEYSGWKEEICRILDDQKEKDVEEALQKKQAAKEKFEKYACEYKTIRDKSRKSTVGSQKCRASQDAQLLESEYQILLYSHDLRREKQLKALAELYFTRTIPFYMQQCQPINDIRLQHFIQDNQHLLQTRN